MMNVGSRIAQRAPQVDNVTYARGLYVAASLGFEPRQRDPESLVLPLHYEATSGKIKTDPVCCKSTEAAFVLI